LKPETQNAPFHTSSQPILGLKTTKTAKKPAKLLPFKPFIKPFVGKN